MKSILLFLSAISLISYCSAQNPCGTDEYHKHLVEQHPERLHQLNVYNTSYEHYKSTVKNSKIQEDKILYIPIVFHILYNTSAENIPESKIYEQLERLNTDFSGTNEDRSNVPDEFKSYASDTRIRFILADTDPDGNPTSGINRYQTDVSKFGITFGDDIKFTASGGADAWDTEKYLNIWIGNISDGLLGYATFPIDAGTARDGVVLNYPIVGNNSKSNYNKGRTATHEIGHYLGLQHLWGSGGCSSDDGFTDTPKQEGPNYGDPVHPVVSCFSNDMFMNYMDYGNDEISVMFTPQQADKMEYSLEITRFKLWIPESPDLNKSALTTMSVYPNPTSDVVYISLSKPVNKGQLYLVDIAGRIHYTQNASFIKNISIPVNQLSKGLYFVGFTGNDGLEIIEKIVID